MIKEHFSSFGDVCTVELVSEDGNPISNASNNCSANVTFLTRDSAEGAFEDGKCWQGQDLKFIWLSSSGENPDGASPEASRDADMEPESEPESIVFKEAPRDEEESENSTRDNSVDVDVEPSDTGKVSPVIERET